ncbi:hypothetical protein U8U95_07195 [Enterococcus faecium]|uniref:hypothetical protein n=1 Tax=Enterococcus faecium TaxID=1352 RepID=UPI00397D8E69
MIEKEEQIDYLRIGNKVIGKTVYGRFFAGEIVSILEKTVIVQRGVNLEVMRKKEIVYYERN